MDDDLSYEVYKMFQKQDQKGFAEALIAFFTKTQDDILNEISKVLEEELTKQHTNKKTFDFDVNIGVLNGNSIKNLASIARSCGLEFEYYKLGGLLVCVYHCIARGTDEQWFLFQHRCSDLF